ncbi:unnamed protein product [Cylicostephanus goldi]|uniref:Uncharacterized protein n=1 Tax=Cylicostephanus goldi TaxID=71465 RepID=A0A3P7MAC3_CYLGO|nr:unnamed protein product [Cylicostephanus goldi]
MRVPKLCGAFLDQDMLDVEKCQLHLPDQKIRRTYHAQDRPMAAEKLLPDLRGLLVLTGSQEQRNGKNTRNHSKCNFLKKPGRVSRGKLY